jgi:glycosyltransferase involved in cell wall biosynthesis
MGKGTLMASVLLVAPTPVTEHCAGPAIRFLAFGRVLSAEQAVTLLVPNKDHLTHPDFAIRTCPEVELGRVLADHQVVVVQGPALQLHPPLAEILRAGEHYVVADLYDPITLEQLELDCGGKRGRWLYREYTALLNEQLQLGDFFLCATERQRDYWLGALAILGRVNPDTYDGTEMRRLIDVVPFGLPKEPPRHAGPVLKGRLPGINPGDQMIVWGGGMWDWLDPLTPIRAMSEVAARHPTSRLVFFESPHYDSDMTQQARQLAAELGLLERNVFFAGWLAAEQWSACLLEADVGLSFHRATVETRFAFRTRLLDYIWAGLPIVTASGDELSAQVVDHGLGYVVEPGDTKALAGGLIALLGEPDARATRREAFQRLAPQFAWERVAEPLARYCREPWYASDIGQGKSGRWHQAERDRMLSDLAHVHRRCADLEALVDTMRAERDLAVGQARLLEAQCAETQVHLDAVLSGRVMRFMTGSQQTLRRLLGGRR